MGRISSALAGLKIEAPPDRTSKIIACDPGRAEDKYVYSIGEEITWGPSEDYALRFEDHDEASARFTAAGINPDRLDFMLMTVML